MRMKLGLKPPARAGQPFVLVEKTAKGLRLAACDAAARALGLHPGQRLADARTMAPGLLSEVHEPHQDAESLLGLARWCERYSPQVSRDGLDGILIDATGCAHLFGGEAEMLADLQARLQRYGFTASLAIAATPGAAWGLARFQSRGGEREVPEAAGMIEALPIEALRIDGKCALLLRRLGLKTIGQLISLPRASLARRFRGEAIPENVLIRLDEAMGLRQEPVVPLAPLPVLRAAQAMMEPLISHEGLEAMLIELIARLARDLEAVGHGVTRLVLRLYKTDGQRLSLPVGLAAASRDPAHLMALLRPKLDQIDAGFGIDALVLEARETAALAPEQTGFLEDGPADQRQIARLSDRVMNRHDGRGFKALQPVQSHLPERAEEGGALGAVALSAGAGAVRDRPLLILDPPEPVRVIAAVPDGPPMRLTWRRVARRIVRAEGPERIAPEWWRLAEAGADVRDYYVIEDDQGRRYWLYREGLYGEPGSAPQWFVHGLFA